MSIQGKKISSLINEFGFFVSRSGNLHKVTEIDGYGSYIKLVTRCGQCITIRNSCRSRAARWIRNSWMRKPCKGCKIKGGEMSRFKICR